MKDNQQESPFELVQKRLQLFTQRYYLNSFLQNMAVFVIASMVLALMLSIVELVFKNESQVRAAVFYGYLAVESFGFIYLVVIPALRIKGMGQVHSDLEMSGIIGKRTNEVNDKLQNALLLKSMHLKTNSPLLEAAIQQKSSELKGIPFHLTANFKRGLNFLKVAGVLMLAVLLTGMSFPDLFNYGAKRIVYYDENIEPPAPFSLEVKSADVAIRNEPYSIEIAVDGELMPGEVFIEIGDAKVKAHKSNFNEFKFRSARIREDFNFRVSAEGLNTEWKSVKVIDRPSILEMNIKIEHPSYLNKKDIELENFGNLVVPDGSQISWKVVSSAGDKVGMAFGNDWVNIPLEKGLAQFDSLFRKTSNYRIAATHTNGLSSDTVNYKIEVVPDQFPKIAVKKESDSLESKAVFLINYSDDYGISEFLFVYKTPDGELQREPLRHNSGETSSKFLYEIDWSKWDLEMGEKMEYYFEVWDNDGVNGRKYSRSQKMTFEIPDQDELKEERKKQSEEIVEDMEEALREAKKLNKEVENLQKELVEEKKFDWSSKKKIQELIQRNESLKKSFSEIEKKNAEKNKLENKLSSTDELIEKRKELQELMEKVMDDELLEKLRELEKMMDELKKEDLNKALDEMEMSNDQLEKELDRALELFKQLEFEQKLNETIEDLEKLEKDQNELMNETEQADKKELNSEEQKQLKEEFEEWEKDLEELNEMNEDLENKQNMDKLEEEREETKESMQKASESMEKGQKQKSKESQKKAGEKMEEMKESLNMVKANMKAQAAEDLQSLRSTLENLVELSFEQENLMDEMNGMRGDDPRFNDLTRKQRDIMEGLSLVEDSLNALGKRVSQIEPTINREIAQTKMNMEKAMKNMTSRKMNEFKRNQQLAMTSVNNLAVLIDEVVSQLQNQMMMQSQGQCSKPGNSNPKPGSMKQLQEQLNKQMEEMKKMMEEKGKQEGSGKGSKGGQEAKSLAKMAAEQAKIREELRKMEKGANQQDAKGLQKIGEMMEETERDIVNREISRQTILRQEKILTKLLESEKAERERDMDEKRESKEGDENKIGNLLDLKEYYKAKESNHEDLIKKSIGYRRFYKKKVEEYFKIIQ